MKGNSENRVGEKNPNHFQEENQMVRENIMLSSIESVKRFVAITNKYDFQINLTTDKYKIDAKSIMGVFSLDLSRPVTLEVESEAAGEFFKEIEPFNV